MTSDDPVSSVKLAITSGEPAGIGADICLSLPAIESTELYILADPLLMQQRAESLGIRRELYIHRDDGEYSENYRPDALNILPVTLKTDCVTGRLDPENSHYVLDQLDRASELCEQGKMDAMVTGPVHKSIINDAGIAFTGHTEYLAERSASTPVMMLATQQLRVALATTHLPLKDVSNAITKESLTLTVTILNDFLIQHAAIEKPKLLVCGLNPHAGEDGKLGDEEIHTITPVIESLKQQGLSLIGPLPADTLFTDKYLDHADAVLAMYHDQGLPVLKYSGFGKAVNVTLGLPFIRTSVDHGTALDLAGSGKASNTSMLEAINMARRLAVKP